MMAAVKRKTIENYINSAVKLVDKNYKKGLGYIKFFAEDLESEGDMENSKRLMEVHDKLKDDYDRFKKTVNDL